VGVKVVGIDETNSFQLQFLFPFQLKFYYYLALKLWPSQVSRFVALEGRG